MEDILNNVLEKIGKVKREVYSFGEYLELVKKNPTLHFRNSSAYLRDCMDYYGTYQVRRGALNKKRFKLFDGEFSDLTPLIGNEEVQQEFYNLLSSRSNKETPGRLILLHGPNGSAKTTFLRHLMAGLEDYSTTPEGAIYRFNWIFPSDIIIPKGIGFKTDRENRKKFNSYAKLEGNQIDAILMDEFRDHPLLLIPLNARKKVLSELAQGEETPEWLLKRDLHPRNKQIFDALLLSSSSGLEEVFKYIQIERFKFSFRYRTGISVIEPKLAVDAHLKQITTDRSLASLPPALQHLDLYRFGGDLVDGNRGIIEFSDIFKRPPEAFKYLLTLLENGKLALNNVLLHFDAIFCGTANDRQLTAFTETPDFASFEGRMDFISMPYLLDYHLESQIIKLYINTDSLGKPITPHVLEAAALWAVMTRLVLPSSSTDAEDDVLKDLTVYDKAILYGDGKVPKGFNEEKTRQLITIIDKLKNERISTHIYEGGIGASPRLLLQLLQKAANKAPFLGFSTLQQELKSLYDDKDKHEFLNYPAQERGFHDIKKFLDFTREHWLSKVEEDLWKSAGLVLKENIIERVEKYLTLVNHYIKKEKIKDPVSGEYHEPSKKIMNSMEDDLEIPLEKRDDFRKECFTRIAAYAVDHEGKAELEIIFNKEIEVLTQKSYKQKISKLIALIKESKEIITNENEKIISNDDVDNFLKSLNKLGYTKETLLEVFGFYLQEKE